VLKIDPLERRLQAVADVLVPDLRGHGFAPLKRGDISHISQLEEDLADLIAAKRKPGQKVVLAGHSSGGGLVVRFAGGDYGDQIDAAILMAPYLQYNAPTTRPNSGGWANPLTRRIIGLSMLNGVGITALNGLTAITFNFPDAVLNGPLGDTATQAYSFRLNTGFAPRADYLADVAKLPEFLLLVGDQDEAFVAEGYAPLMAAVTDKGRYVIVKDASHLAVVDDPASLAAMTDFIGKIASR
jgi:alpha-beta hydrolase superfamily lysophospholipase